jgi:signal transduction histidine kinase
MKVDEVAASADSIAFVARALRSLDAGVLLPPAAPRLAKPRAQSSLKAALRNCESEVRLLSAQFMAAQELERQRIARELHDSVGQALGGVKFALESCEAQIAAGAGDAAVRTLRQLSERIGAVIDEVHRVSMNLRPSTLDDLGILPTLAGLSREFRAIYHQLELETVINVRESEIAAPVKTAIYRIVQEALHNVVTHSGARKVSLVLRRCGRQLELLVQDDGVGAEAAGRGLGLSTMRERAEITGGRFALRAAKGRGTTVAVTWPVYNEAVRT